MKGETWRFGVPAVGERRARGFFGKFFCGRFTSEK
jgi:hypothetical protein